MRITFTMLLLGLLSLVFQGSAQKILMEIPGVTSKDGEPINALEFVIDNSNIIGSIAGGGSPSKATTKAYKFKKEANATTSLFFENIVKGIPLEKVIFKYYNEANTPYYTIELETAYITEMSWLSPECPSCIQLEHLVSIYFFKVTTEDKINNVIKSWNFSTNNSN